MNWETEKENSHILPIQKQSLAVNFLHQFEKKLDSIYIPTSTNPLPSLLKKGGNYASSNIVISFTNSISNQNISFYSLLKLRLLKWKTAAKKTFSGIPECTSNKDTRVREKKKYKQTPLLFLPQTFFSPSHGTLCI